VGSVAGGQLRQHPDAVALLAGGPGRAGARHLVVAPAEVPAVVSPGAPGSGMRICV